MLQTALLKTFGLEVAVLKAAVVEVGLVMFGPLGIRKMKTVLILTVSQLRVGLLKVQQLRTGILGIVCLRESMLLEIELLGSVLLGPVLSVTLQLIAMLSGLVLLIALLQESIVLWLGVNLMIAVLLEDPGTRQLSGRLTNETTRSRCLKSWPLSLGNQV